ncbi:MAG: hypothetical protein LQ351_000727 [Letrouitia transgressa]|nr:MAG: hypothetical protein LQ351_000727 [Letrouitia transgressa]
MSASECLVDAYNLTTCPNCARDISSHNSAGIEQVLCSLDNEGGLQHEVDILPLLKYESYNKAFPEEQRPRAFLAFCAEGDIGTVIDEINDNGDDSDDEYGGEDNMQVDETSGREEIVNRIDPLRYQDPTDNMNSALHVAILNNQEEIAWVLLLIASTLEPNMFPTEVKQAASVLGAKREDQANKVDIRTLKNSDGKTGHDLAVEIGGVWNDWVNKRRLTA